MRVNVRNLIVQVVGVFLIFSLALFVPAGTISWSAGWIFLGLFFSFSILIFSWLYKHNPGLLYERTRLATADQQGWDKYLFPLINIYLLGWLIFISLDVRL